MTWELKPISREAIPEALEKVERYRLLNEPAEAESICLDILEVDPENQSALIMLLLSLTDQFGSGASTSEALEVIGRLKGDYERAYYRGIVYERAAKWQIRLGAPGAHFNAYQGLREAMSWYEKAEAIRPSGNDDSILRWNTCARLLSGQAHVERADEYEPALEE